MLGKTFNKDKRGWDILEKVKLEEIRITDSLFGSYTKQVSNKILKYQWKVLNDQQEDAFPTYCITNFKVAARDLKGERKGVVFQDTDLYKWLEAVAFCIANGTGKAFEETADEVIELVGRAQEEDGYLNTYFTVMAPEKKWSNLVEGHELYTAGHLMEAACAYYEATKKDRLLKIAIKNADLICKVFGPLENQKHGYPGHQEVEIGLVKLYRLTGEKKYLDCAYYFIKERGKEPSYFLKEIKKRGGYEFFPEFDNYDLSYSQAHMEPIKQKSAEGHAVRAMYMCSAMADLAGEYKDDELLDACKAIWDNVTRKRMYITGGIGSSGFLERFTMDYDLPNRTNYSETCASIGLMMFGQRMTQVTGEAKYYNTVERALYNTVLAGINIEGDRYFYVNPLEMVPEFCTKRTYMNHVKAKRQKWFDVACCPTNVARTLASLGQYIFAKEDDTLYIHQFITSSVNTKLKDSALHIEMESTLLQNGIVKILAKTVTEESLKIKIRIPDYAKNTRVLINEEVIEPKVDKGYFLVLLKPAAQQEILIDFGVKARWMTANDEVREDCGKAALMKGPLVYCLEEKENGRNLSGIYVDIKKEINECDAANDLVGNLPMLSYKGIHLENIGILEEELYGEPKLEQKLVDLKAVPYCLWNNRGIGEMLVWQKIKL
jgi:uncharacterized protein